MILVCRLGDEDRAKYGGDEWLRLDEQALDQLEADELFALEKEMDLSVWEYRYVEKVRMSGRAIKAICWMARQFSGDEALKLPSWKEFRIHPATAQVMRADVVPPVGTPASPAGDTPTAAASSSESGEATEPSGPSAPSSPRSRARGTGQASRPANGAA